MIGLFLVALLLFGPLCGALGVKVMDTYETTGVLLVWLGATCGAAGASGGVFYLCIIK